MDANAGRVQDGGVGVRFRDACLLNDAGLSNPPLRLLYDKVVEYLLCLYLCVAKYTLLDQTMAPVKRHLD